MTIEEYESQFQEILDKKKTSSPYDSEDYLHYVKMNQSRIKRWKKTVEISDKLTKNISNINEPLTLVLITEPWCGDAANSHAIIGKIASDNPNINLVIQNRDAENSEIENYLTNGGKSIPKLIIRDAKGKDLGVWGPRPEGAQELVTHQKTDKDLSLDDRIIQIQKWYNNDKGTSIQEEINNIITNIK